MRAPRLSFAILLAFLLVFAQQAAAIHALSHFTDKQQDRQEKHPPGTKACEKCAVFAKLGNAIPSTEAFFVLSKSTQFLTCVSLDGVTHLGFSPYQSRAPPYLP
jgi:hypothetical protein